MTAPAEYREIPFPKGACPVCDEVVNVSLPRSMAQRPALWAHGPLGNRCPGSRQRPKPWLEASRLPTWEQMSELDRGAALLHVWKRHWEGASYAISDYPCRYLDNPILVGLDERTASKHAAAVCGRHEAVLARLGVEEHDRLYNLALAAERAVPTAEMEEAR